MKQSRFDNPDYVKYAKKQANKKQLLAALAAKIARCDKWIKYETDYIKRCQESILKEQIKREQLMRDYSFEAGKP